jgi:hypothetical protein
MEQSGTHPGTARFASELRGEVVDGVVLLLDATNAVVFRLEGDQADVARLVLADRDIPRELTGAATEMEAAGLVVRVGADHHAHADASGAMIRRRFLAGAAVATGVAVFHLPSAAAASSTAGGGGPDGGGGGGNQAPAAPSISGPAPSDGSVTFDVIQTDNGGGAITNYEYSVDDGGWTPFSPAQTSGPFTVTGLSGPASIRVRAVNASGASAPSAAVPVTPLALPAAPVVTAASAASLTSVTLTFTQGGSAAVSGYEASTDDGTSWVPVSTSSGTATVTGVTDGSSIRLRAVNDDGSSPASNSTTAAYGSQTFTASGTFTVPAGVTLVDLELYGGAGASGQGRGANVGGTGGQPAKVTGRFTAVPGSTRSVIIGLGGIGSGRGTGDASGGFGGVHQQTSPTSLEGGSGGGGGGATSVKGSGLTVHAGGGGGGGGAAFTSGNGGNATLNVGGGAAAGWADDCQDGGGGGGGGGGGAVADQGHPGASGYNATTPGLGGGTGGSKTTGLTAPTSTIASGRSVSASPTRSQSGEATFRWTTVTVH